MSGKHTKIFFGKKAYFIFKYMIVEVEEILLWEEDG